MELSCLVIFGSHLRKHFKHIHLRVYHAERSMAEMEIHFSKQLIVIKKHSNIYSYGVVCGVCMLVYPPAGTGC